MCGAIVTGGSWGAGAEKCTPLRSILVGPPAKARLVSRSSKKSAATMSMALDATPGASRPPCPRAADERPPQLQGAAPREHGVPGAPRRTRVAGSPGWAPRHEPDRASRASSRSQSAPSATATSTSSMPFTCRSTKPGATTLPSPGSHDGRTSSIRPSTTVISTGQDNACDPASGSSAAAARRTMDAPDDTAGTVPDRVVGPNRHRDGRPGGSSLPAVSDRDPGSTREAILDAARMAFAERGFAGASLGDLAPHAIGRPPGQDRERTDVEVTVAAA